MENNTQALGSELKGMVRPVEMLIKHFRDTGHDDDADALEIVDFLMCEYAYTFDPMTDDAKALGQSLRDIVGAWLKRGYGEPMA